MLELVAAVCVGGFLGATAMAGVAARAMAWKEDEMAANTGGDADYVRGYTAGRRDERRKPTHLSLVASRP